jgi:hypothetical protein
MTQRIQVRPFHEFGADVSWITQDIIEGYIYAQIKGERFAQAYVAKYAQGDPGRMKVFTEVLLDDPDFDDLRWQIWAEMELPTPGSIEYHIWKIERTLEDPKTPVEEHAKLYKILGEYRGWITKPGEGKTQTVNINNVGSAVDYRSLSAKDAELLYLSAMNGNR